MCVITEHETSEGSDDWIGFRPELNLYLKPDQLWSGGSLKDQLCVDLVLVSVLSGSPSDVGDEHDHRVPGSPSAYCHPGSCR